VLIVEVHRPPGLDGAVDARHFEVEQRLHPTAGRRERELLDEAQRVGEVFEDVAADHQVRA